MLSTEAKDKKKMQIGKESSLNYIVIGPGNEFEGAMASINDLYKLIFVEIEEEPDNSCVGRSLKEARLIPAFSELPGHTWVTYSSTSGM